MDRGAWRAAWGRKKKKKKKTKGRAPFVGLAGGAGRGALLAGRGSEPIPTVLKLSLPQNPLEGLSKTQIAGPTPRASVVGTKSWSSPVQFSSVTQSCPTLCDPINRSTPGLPVHHQIPEFTQTHVHPVTDAIQPSHPLSSPSPPTLNLSQHQGLFK